jgi:hypothetical protein
VWRAGVQWFDMGAGLVVGGCLGTWYNAGCACAAGSLCGGAEEACGFEDVLA